MIGADGLSSEVIGEAPKPTTGKEIMLSHYPNA
jgi:hypothetical protein